MIKILELPKETELFIPFSSGKDSTATVIKLHELGYKNVTVGHVALTYDTRSCVDDEQLEFVYKCFELFSKWGYECDLECVNVRHYLLGSYERGKYKGEQRGFSALNVGCMCAVKRMKIDGGKRLNKRHNNCITVIGYAFDEKERYERCKDTEGSILYELGVKEVDSMEICRLYNLVSPVYAKGVTRDGCIFCANAKRNEWEKNINDPIILELIKATPNKYIEHEYTMNYRSNLFKIYTKEEILERKYN